MEGRAGGPLLRWLCQFSRCVALQRLAGFTQLMLAAQCPTVQHACRLAQQAQRCCCLRCLTVAHPAERQQLTQLPR